MIHNSEPDTQHVQYKKVESTNHTNACHLLAKGGGYMGDRLKVVLKEVKSKSSTVTVLNSLEDVHLLGDDKLQIAWHQFSPDRSR